MENNELPLSYRQIFLKLKEKVDISLKGGLQRQSPDFIEDFAHLYLQGLSVLTHIKARPALKTSLPPLQKILVQSHLLLYPEASEKQSSFWQWLWRDYPATLWAQRYFHLASFGVVALTGLIGYIVVQQNFEMASVFIPPFLRASHELDAYLFSPEAQKEMLTAGRESTLEIKTLFSWLLWINNTKVAVLCFISGFAFGIPTLMILIQTGLMLGTFPALFREGDIVGLWAWLLPHGVPEIMAIVLAGGIGLQLGWAMLNPGHLPMGRAVRQTLRGNVMTIVLCALLLVWAAIVESFIRQSELDNPTRLLIAAASTVPFILLFVRAAFAHQSKSPVEIEK